MDPSSCLQQAIKLQRRAAERALIQLHKRTKTEAGENPDAAPSQIQGGHIAVETSHEVTNPFLGAPDREYASLRPIESTRHATATDMAPQLVTNSLAAWGTLGSSSDVVAVPGSLLLDSCPHHIVFDRDLVLRKLGPAIRNAVPWVELGRTLLTDAFQVRWI
jgi:hypothetical protein